MQMVNPTPAVAGPFRPGVFWSILAQAEGARGRWPRLMKYVNEPDGFLAQWPHGT